MTTDARPHLGDDDTLLQEVAAAQAETAPPELIAEAKALYTWRTVDAELAALSYDSATETQALEVRSETATLRSLTFETQTLTVDVGLAADAVHGQLVPPRPGRVEVHTPTTLWSVVAADEAGCFTIRPRPPGRFRLHCTTSEAGRVLTSWIDP